MCVRREHVGSKWVRLYKRYESQTRHAVVCPLFLQGKGEAKKIFSFFFFAKRFIISLAKCYSVQVHCPCSSACWRRLLSSLYWLPWIPWFSVLLCADLSQSLVLSSICAYTVVLGSIASRDITPNIFLLLHLLVQIRTWTLRRTAPSQVEITDRNCSDHSTTSYHIISPPRDLLPSIIIIIIIITGIFLLGTV